MGELDTELQLTSDADGLPIRNLYPLYLHEIASYEHLPPNQHGILTDKPDVRTWEQLLEGQADWWKKPDALFPYLIRVGGVPAGFNLIASGSYVPTSNIDFVVYEFFLAHAWRGTGVAAEAVRQGLALHRGTWEVLTWTTAPRAIAFWRKTLAACIEGEIRETEEDHKWGRRVAFRFHNRTE